MREAGLFVSSREDLAVAGQVIDDDGETEEFPVMVRLGEVQYQIAALARRIEHLGETIDRLEQGVRLIRIGEEPLRQGVTARANPMTHPVTPFSAPTTLDTGRDEALASVRELFMRRRPWWQRLPDLLRG